jgi:hypothetical protein
VPSPRPRVGPVKPRWPEGFECQAGAGVKVSSGYRVLTGIGFLRARSRTLLRCIRCAAPLCKGIERVIDRSSFPGRI